MSKFWDIEDNGFDLDKAKKDFINNLDYIATMSVEEQTLYKKWIELNEDLHGNFEKLPLFDSYYDIQWFPTDIYNKERTIKEILLLEPYVEICDTKEKVSQWVDIRKMIHTMSYDSSPGRNLKGIVKDRVTGKILGLIGLSSDVTSLGVRDRWIGWSKEDKFVRGKLNNTAIASSIVSVQPLGYNMLGGKLIALMCTTEPIRSEWKSRYDNTLVGITTTSLYGIHSQYNGLPNFKTLGESKGMISIKPDDKVYVPLHHWIKELDPIWYEKASNTTGPKQNVLTRLFKECGINPKKYNHGFQRGVYFAPMYENGKEYLCSKIDESELILKPAYTTDKHILWWKDKAVKRYSKLYDEGKIKPESLYYRECIGMTWDDCKTKFLKDVGR